MLFAWSHGAATVHMKLFSNKRFFHQTKMPNSTSIHSIFALYMNNFAYNDRDGEVGPEFWFARVWQFQV